MVDFPSCSLNYLILDSRSTTVNLNLSSYPWWWVVVLSSSEITVSLSVNFLFRSSYSNPFFYKSTVILDYLFLVRTNSFSRSLILNSNLPITYLCFSSCSLLSTVDVITLVSIDLSAYLFENSSLSFCMALSYSNFCSVKSWFKS